MKSAIIEVIKMSWPTLVIILSIMIIMRITLYFKGDRQRLIIHEEIFKLFFVAYLLILFQLVTSQDIQAYKGTNLIPFREILRYEPGTTAFYKQVIGNILMFIPLGYFMTSFCKIRELGTITIVSILSSFVIEIVQNYIGRSFDVDDIILNVVGGIIGFLLYISLNAIRNHMPSFLRKDWFLNIISIVLVIIAVLYVVKVI